MRIALGLALTLTVLTAAAGCGGGSTTTPPTTSPPPATSTGACTIPFETASRDRVTPAAKPESTSDRRTRRGRVYEELWKHQAATARAAASGGARPASFEPAATTEDIGQIAVMRDEGDLVVAANRFDLQAKGFIFARNGSGGYDVRPSSRAFQSSVGDKISLTDDSSARLALPFTFPFYAGRYTEAFLNSDGNVTFVSEDHASTDRNVARFLTGPPRIAAAFDDLDPSRWAASSGVPTATRCS